MAIQIKKAVKFGAKCRLALYGPPGSGKTYTSLAIARELAGDKRIVVIDTERRSASKYADLFDFDVIELEDFHPHTYIDAINAVVRTKEHSVLIIDSITHEWDGSKGALEMAGQDFRNWAKVTPLHNDFIDAMLKADIHVIATMRAKEDHVMEKVEGKAKPEIRSVGIEPIQRKGMQYEFDIVGSLDIDNTLTIVKTRCSALQGGVFYQAGGQVVDILKPWLDGAPAPDRIITADHLTSIKARGKRAGLYTNLEEFEAFLQYTLGIDEPIEATTLTENQARDIEARIADRERQLKEKAS